MRYNIRLDTRLHKSFKKLDKKLVNSILGAISELENFSLETRQVKKLQTPFDGYRKRIGDYRIFFKVEQSDIFVYLIKHRKDSYK